MVPKLTGNFLRYKSLREIASNLELLAFLKGFYILSFETNAA
ncbi:hypothetical protein LEP1GSC024_2645 [Leptospira noguchii str. 2001034031]|uniref:Uncharacterized protein n=1 Tax=Leptospira noguchii str. 2001034031 TaxID=1193053 RepID=M6YPQ8_9LEPT|nr:hypothetical protein LEP1GSC024_2645 [Leptospira noguchii str. 2001034031]